MSTLKNCDAAADPFVMEPGTWLSVRTGAQAASRLKLEVVCVRDQLHVGAQLLGGQLRRIGVEIEAAIGRHAVT